MQEMLTLSQSSWSIGSRSNLSLRHGKTVANTGGSPGADQAETRVNSASSAAASQIKQHNHRPFAKFFRQSLCLCRHFAARSRLVHRDKYEPGQVLQLRLRLL